MNLPERNKTAIILMVVSMLLLTTFQLFWLKKEYSEQRNNLFTKADLIFEQTIRGIEDSMVMAGLNNAISEQKKKDSISGGTSKPIAINLSKGENLEISKSQRDGKEIKLIKKYNTINITGDQTMVFKHGGDSGIQRFTVDNLKTYVTDSNQVFTVKNSHDSVSNQNVMISFVTKTGEDPDNKKQISKALLPMRMALRKKELSSEAIGVENTFGPLQINFSSDSIQLDSLKIKFTEELNTAGIKLNPKIWKDTASVQDSIRVNSPEVISARSSFTDSNYYASFLGIEGYLFSKILSQIGFSFLLLGLTGLSFTFIYRSLKQQHKLNTIKNDLISNISHELKTPLTTVSVALEALQSFSENEEKIKTQEYLEISRNEIAKLTAMVETILHSSAHGDISAKLKLEQIDLLEFISELLKTWQPVIDKNGAQLVVKSSGENFSILLDPLFMTGIFNNLMDNSIKYSEGNAVIDIAVFEKNEEILVSFKDNGPGIPDEFKSMIFDKFFRVPTGNIHTVKGYGLGLNYVQNAVNLQNGTIKLSSSDAQGCEFILKFKKYKSNSDG